MNQTLLGGVLVGVALLAARRRWVSAPFAVMLVISWAAALDWLPTMLLESAIFPVLAFGALWTELGWVVLGAAEIPSQTESEAALAGVVFGVSVGAIAWVIGFHAAVVLLLGYVGGVSGTMRAGSNFATSWVAATLLPVRGEAAAGVMPVLFLACLALGAVPR